MQGAPVVELHTPSAPSRVQKHKPSFNLSRSGPLGYSVWLVLSSWCDYPIGNHLCGDCRACSCAIPPETDVRRGKKEGISNKTLGFSGSWSFIYMHHLWYNQDRSWNYNWQCQHDVSFSLSLAFCRSNRKKWCLNIGSECFKKKTHKKTNKKWSFKSALCIFRTQIVLVKLRKKKEEIFGSTSVLNLLFVESEKWSKLRLSQRQSDSPLMEDTISGTICRLFVKSRSIPDGRWTDDENESALTQLSLASRAWKSVHISTCGKREINKKQRRMDKSIKM